MKKIITTYIILIVALSGYSQSHWSFSSAPYQHNMSIIAKIDAGEVVVSADDQIAAFSGSELRGVATPVFKNSKNCWYLYLNVHSNDDNIDISFKYYSKSLNKELVLAETEVFRINKVVGSSSSPKVFDISGFAPKSVETDFDAFSFTEQVSEAVIDKVNHTIDISVSNSTDLSSLISTFEISTGAKAYINSVEQVSGTTANNFTTAITYRVVAENGTTEQNWNVRVTRVLSTHTDITQFTVPNQIGETSINEINHTIDIIIPHASDISSLVAVFNLSAGATAYVASAEQISGTISNDFSSTVTYRIVAEDGTSSQNWLVSVTQALSAETEIVSYSLPGQSSAAVIDNSNKRINVKMPHSADLSNLVSQFEVSSGSSAYVGAVKQVSGVSSNNFSTLIVYKVIAEDGTTMQNWIVEVEKALSVETDIKSFNFTDAVTTAQIDSDNHTVSISVTSTTSLESLVSLFTLSEGAKAYVSDNLQVSGVSSNNFSSPVTYRIVAEDGTTEQNWTVTVSNAVSTQTNIKSFAIPGQISATEIDNNAKSINVKMSSVTDLSSLVAAFELSYGANVNINSVEQVSGTTANNFTTALTYNVIAEDGTTNTDWTVTVTNAVSLEADIKTFSFAEQVGEAVIDNNSDSVKIKVGFGTDMTSLIASFSLSYGAKAYVGDVEQVSGTTANNFTALVSYKVVAQDGATEKNWKIEVSNQKNGEAEIENISAENQIGDSDMKTEDNEIELVVPSETDLSSVALTFRLSHGAEAYVGNTLQESGITMNNFNGPVTYRIVAENGTTKYWVVNMICKPECDFKMYSVSNTTGNAEIDIDNNIINIEVLYGTVLDSLKAEFELTDNVKAYVSGVEQQSGTSKNDFTDTVKYVISTTDGKYLEKWSVVASTAKNHQTEVVSFSMSGQIGDTDINDNTTNIFITSPAKEGNDSRVVSFTLSDGASAYVGDKKQESGVTANDFTNPVVYRIVAANGTDEQYWTVIITPEKITSVNDKLDQEVKVYPTVVMDGIIRVQSINQLEYDIFSLSGQFLQRGKTDPGATEIELSLRLKGLILLHLKNNGKIIKSTKLIIK